MSCLTVVPHAPNRILVFAAQDYRDFLHVFVALVAKIAVFAAQDSGDFCAVFQRFCRTKLSRIFKFTFLIEKWIRGLNALRFESE